MSYEVIWQQITEQELAAAWLAATDRNAVTHAAASLDGQLAHDPLRLGESRTSSVHRIAYFPPLGVEFEVVEDDKRVIVQGVFTISK